MLRLLIALVWFVGCAARLVATEPPVEPAAIRAAVARSLPMLAASAREFTKQRECFACHHQTLPLLALTTARGKGFAIADDDVRHQVNWTLQFLTRNESRFREGKGTGGQADSAGYALWALALGDHAPDKITEAVADYLVQRHKDRDHWSRTSRRPPSEASDFTTTFLAVQGLSRYAPEDLRERANERMAKAKEWLLKTEATDTEDHVFRLRGLHAAGADPEKVCEAADQLLALQRDDGGWAQLSDLSSDAYATGSALVALAHTGHLDPSDDRYQRAIRFLLASQREDGSWHVTTRSTPIQEYFESGFPHGADQFISIAATSWAVTALSLALPENEEGLNEFNIVIP